MEQTTLAILLAFFGYSFLNVGQAGQKIGLGKRRESALKGWTIWGISTAGTFLSTPLIFAAIILGSVSISGSMAGTGLVSLAVFSRLVLKEELKKRTVLVILAIVLAAAVLGFFDKSGESEMRSFWLYMLLGGGSVLYILTIWTVPSGSLRGVMIGGLAGFFGACSQLFQRYSTDSISLEEGVLPLLGNVIRNPVTLIWIALLLLSMLVLQFSYRHAEAIQIVPVFTVNTIVVPVFGSVIVFGEVLTLPQWIALAVMVAGSVLLGRRKDRSEKSKNSS